MIIKPWLSISFSSSTYNFRHCHKLCVRFSSLWVTPSFTVSSSMSASAASFIATQSPLPWLYSYQTLDCSLLNCLRLVSIYQGFHPAFLPTEAVCLTVWNPRKPLSGLSTLCLPLLWSFIAAIFHCSDYSFLITHRLCSLAAITSRRVWLLFLRLPAVVSFLQLCFRPKQVSSFFIAAFFPRLGLSLSDWSPIHLCCRFIRCLSCQLLLLLSFQFFPLSFKSFCPLQSMHSKSEDFFMRWFHTFADCSPHHPTTDFATVFVHFDPNSPP